MARRVLTVVPLIAGIIASAFVVAYHYFQPGTALSLAATQCLPETTQTEKRNPNRIFFISCGGFL